MDAACTASDEQETKEQMEATVTKGERFYTVAINGIVVAQAQEIQGAADYIWAMKLNARWMIYNEGDKP